MQMMTDQYAVFDDVLSPEQHRALLMYLQKHDWRSVHSEGLANSFQFPDDGNPLRAADGTAAYLPDIDPEAAREALRQASMANRFAVHPTGTPVDFVLDAVRARTKQCESIIGVAGRDWLGVHAVSYIYPVGTSISWHRDGTKYTGAYIYYAHPVWNSQWGGELMIADRSAMEVETPNAHHSLRVRFLLEEERCPGVMAAGGGAFIVAKPNRLVILQGNNQHKINPVHPSAGNHVRIGVTGLFYAQNEHASSDLSALVQAARALSAKK